MDIKPGYGTDAIPFGIKKDRLIKLIGQPDKIDVDSFENPLLIYNSIRTTFWIGDDMRLHWIQCSSPKALLFDRVVIGVPIEKVISEVVAELKGEIKMEDFGSTESYMIDSHQLELQVEYGVVRAICFGNYWADDDSPIYHHD